MSDLLLPASPNAPARQRRKGVTRLAVTLALGVLLTGGGAYQLGGGVYIIAKAHAAQWLVERAWGSNLTAGTTTARPWEWADMTPVARLTFLRQRASTIVFDNDTPRTLAFGPGVRAGSAQPGERGNTVISAHRDTHFLMLRDIAPGDVIEMQTVEDQQHVYRVVQRTIVDESDISIAQDHGIDELTLITCWPFDALVPGGPLRLIVRTERVR